MQREASGLHPSWRFRHTLNQQIVAFGNGPDKKMLINHERSLNVYENKQNKDNMPERNSGISACLTPICRKLRLVNSNLSSKAGERRVYSGS
jgi:hypothetical protein